MATLLLYVSIGLLIAVLAAAAIYFRKRQVHAKCADCGSPSQFGYSHRAESDAKDIVKLCLACLTTKLHNDYQRYEARALVIEPAANLPCYVFQPQSKWADSKLMKETSVLLSNMQKTCGHCESKANFLWMTSQGLLDSNFDEVLTEGLSQTLFRWGNDPPSAICGECCVKQIVKTIESNGLTFLEVCSPHAEDGFVIPMGY